MPATRTAVPAASTDTPPDGPYTGVVLIHGLGDIARNDTIEEYLNALTYWYNHEAGFDLRQEGAGRVWLTTALTDDPSPDARASRATMVLTPPASQSAGSTEEAPLRLEFREVWWSDSHGTPSVASTIRWARFQYGQEASRLLLPFDLKKKRAELGRMYEPEGEANRDAAGTRSALTGSGRSRPPLAPAARAFMRGFLRGYDAFQNIWKALVWLFLTPVITILLLVMGLFRLLAVIPFFQGAAVSGFNAVANKVMLRWVSSMQTYLLDYTLSAGIRARFEREVRAFLADEHCERIVVIAHSWGTVIAYEGLTTTLAEAAEAHPGAQPKPVTFICLAAALRRAWLLDEADPHRLHGVLPDYVRWLHFWGRYDPVAAGPLVPASLPPLEQWPDHVDRNPYQPLVASLGRCTNYCVVNTDIIFGDHTSYTSNLEQVVGPLACELVAGHSALARAVESHLASPDDVLRRRWRIGWRTASTILGGIVAGAAVLALEILSREALGHLVQDSIGPALRGFVTIFCSASVCQEIASGNVPAVDIQQFLQPLAGTGIWIPLALLALGITPFFSALALVAVVTLTVTGVSKALAQPSPFSFTRTSPNQRGRPMALIFAVSVPALVLVAVAKFLVSDYFIAQRRMQGLPLDTVDATYLTVVAFAQLVGTILFVLAFVDAIGRRRFAWAAIFPLAWLAAYGGTFVVDTFLVLLAAGGLPAAIRVTVRHRQWAWFGALVVLVVALAYVALGPIVYSLAGYRPDSHPSTSVVVLASFLGESPAPYMALLAYGLFTGPMQFARRRQYSLALLAAFGLSALLFAALALAGVSHLFLSLQPYVEGGTVQVLSWAIMTSAAVGALVLCLLDALRKGRWNWATAMPLVAIAAFALFDALTRVPGYAASGTGYAYMLAFATPEPVLIALALFTATLTYLLWAGPRTERQRAKFVALEAAKSGATPR